MTRVLIVDDSAFMRKILRNILEKNNCEVVGEAADGKDALNKINELKPNLVTLDITMPYMGGIECLSKIQELVSAPFVIMISSMGQDANVVESVCLGAKGFIVKPFLEETIVSMLRKLFDQSNML